MDLGSGRRRETRSAWKRRREGISVRAAHTVVRCSSGPAPRSFLKVTLQQGRSAAPFVSCPSAAQSGPPSKASQRAGQLLGRTSSARDSVLVTLFQLLLVSSLLIYCTPACLALPVAALLLCSALLFLLCPAASRQSIRSLAAGPVHACVRPDDGLSYS